MPRRKNAGREEKKRKARRAHDNLEEKERANPSLFCLRCLFAASPRALFSLSLSTSLTGRLLYLPFSSSSSSPPSSDRKSLFFLVPPPVSPSWCFFFSFLSPSSAFPQSPEGSGRDEIFPLPAPPSDRAPEVSLLSSVDGLPAGFSLSFFSLVSFV